LGFGVGGGVVALVVGGVLCAKAEIGDIGCEGEDLGGGLVKSE
jgi:hypothetical protein